MHHFTDYQHFTLHIISISLYKIVGFYFTYYQYFTLQIVKTMVRMAAEQRIINPNHQKLQVLMIY